MNDIQSRKSQQPDANRTGPTPTPARRNEIAAHREHSIEKGIGLCLSGGGYRAMLFHAGSLWRLNEAGFLPRLKRISSVSGGSITNGVLALAWNDLEFDSNGVAKNFQECVAAPLMKLASTTTIGVLGIAFGLAVTSYPAWRVQRSYEEYLFGTKTLQSLPDHPRFVINATSVQSGVLWRFSKPYMGDYRVGQVKAPTVRLSTAVAASSAFPPFLSPVVVSLKDCDPHTSERTSGPVAMSRRSS